MSYNLFLSHSWKYQDHYQTLIARLRDSDLLFKNYSVPEDNPITGARTDRQLYEAIETQIRSCSVVLIMAGVYATYSHWINKEIEIARRLGKPIIAICPFGAERLSEPVQHAATKVVGWNMPAIVRAIKECAIRGDR